MPCTRHGLERLPLGCRWPWHGRPRADSLPFADVPSSCDGRLRFFAAKAADGSVRIAYQTADEPPFLQKKCGWLKLGAWEAAGDGVRWKWANMYTTSIHAVNSLGAPSHTLVPHLGFSRS